MFIDVATTLLEIRSSAAKLERQLGWYLASIAGISPSLTLTNNLSSPNNTATWCTRLSITKLMALRRHPSLLSQKMPVGWKFELLKDEQVVLPQLSQGSLGVSALVYFLLCPLKMILTKEFLHVLWNFAWCNRHASPNVWPIPQNL